MNPKNSTQSATSSIFQERQEGAPSESKVGSNPKSNLVGVFLELLTSPSAIFVYRGNSVCYPKSLYDTRYQIWRWTGLVGVSPLLCEGGILKPVMIISSKFSLVKTNQTQDNNPTLFGKGSLFPIKQLKHEKLHRK